MPIRNVIDSFVARAVELDDGTFGGLADAVDAAKVARALSDAAVNLAALDDRDTPVVFVEPGDTVIDHDGFVWLFDDAEWMIVDYVGDDPEIQADFDVDDELGFAGSCDDPGCPCNADCCDECGGLISDEVDIEDDVVATLTITDDKVSVRVDGLCDHHGKLLAGELFEAAARYEGIDLEDDEFLQSQAGAGVVIGVSGPVV